VRKPLVENILTNYYLQFYCFLADGQRVADKHVGPAVKYRLLCSKYLTVGVHHGLHDVSVDPPGALVWLYVDKIMVDVTPE